MRERFNRIDTLKSHQLAHEKIHISSVKDDVLSFSSHIEAESGTDFVAIPTVIDDTQNVGLRTESQHDEGQSISGINNESKTSTETPLLDLDTNFKDSNLVNTEVSYEDANSGQCGQAGIQEVSYVDMNERDGSQVETQVSYVDMNERDGSQIETQVSEDDMKDNGIQGSQTVSCASER